MDRNGYQQNAANDERSTFLIPRKPLPSETTDVRHVQSPQPTGEKKFSVSKRSFSFLGTAWIVEIVSLCLSYLMLAAIIITLATHQGRPIPRWPRLISINSLIAIFTAILKASLILPVAEGLGQLKWNWFQKTRPLIDLDRLDSATRGPWGSLLILFSSCRSFLIYLGAFITVVALAIDPFSQQVVQYRELPQIVEGVHATLPVATNYTRYGSDSSAKDRTLDLQMVNAIYSGSINPTNNASSSIVFDCPKGNCTFPETDGFTHQSLAMCGRCEDRTSTVIQSFHNTSNTTTEWSYILPATFDERFYARKNATITSSIFPDVSTGKTRTGVETWLSIGPWASSYGSWYVTAFDALMYRDCQCATDTGCKCGVLGANCALYPCLKSYKAEVINFTLYETEVSSVRLGNSTLTPDWGYGGLANSTIRNGQPYECRVSKGANSEFPLQVLANYAYNSKTNTTSYVYDYYPEGCLYQFGWSPTWAMRMYMLNTMWNGTLTYTEKNDPSGADGSPWLLSMFHNGSATLETLQNYTDGLTNSLTAVIRQYGDSPSVAQPRGIVWQNQTCVIVAWAWLSLPAALLLLTTLFLTMTIWTTSRSQEEIWKSSALALLFHGFDHDFVEKHSGIGNANEMRNCSRTIYSRVEMQGGRGYLTAG